MALSEVESNMAARRPSWILSEIVCDLYVPHMDLHNIIHIAGADPGILERGAYPAPCERLSCRKR